MYIKVYNAREALNVVLIALEDEVDLAGRLEFWVYTGQKVKVVKALKHAGKGLGLTLKEALHSVNAIWDPGDPALTLAEAKAAITQLDAQAL